MQVSALSTGAGCPRTSVDLVGQSAVASSRHAAKRVYDPLTLWKKLPGRNDRREDTISVAGRPPDSRLARATSDKEVKRFG